MKLLSVQNFKTIKGEKQGYMTAILYLAPSDIVDGINICKFASKGCKAACLFTAGRGVMKPVKDARIRKTVMYRDDIDGFMYQIRSDITKFIRKAERKGLIPVIRLNGTSDIDFSTFLFSDMLECTIFELFPNVQFYDYTKDIKKIEKNRFKNYHLTYSWSESNHHQKHALKLLKQGKTNVAIVFEDLPKTFKGYHVISGDNTDLRFLDIEGVVIGLTAKGKARKDTTGFVIRRA